MVIAVPPLVEPVAIQETYIDGIARIEQVGPNLKLTFFSLQRPSSGDEYELERVVVAKFVMSAKAVSAAAMQAIAATETIVMMPPTH